MLPLRTEARADGVKGRREKYIKVVGGGHLGVSQEKPGSHSARLIGICISLGLNSQNLPFPQSVTLPSSLGEHELLAQCLAPIPVTCPPLQRPRHTATLPSSLLLDLASVMALDISPQSVCQAASITVSTAAPPPSQPLDGSFQEVIHVASFCHHRHLCQDSINHFKKTGVHFLLHMSNPSIGNHGTPVRLLGQMAQQPTFLHTHALNSVMGQVSPAGPGPYS